MNKRKQARKQAEVMLAYADGAEIEYRERAFDTWREAATPQWEWKTIHYRAKQTGSDRVRELLKQGKPVLCYVSDISQLTAESEPKNPVTSVRAYDRGFVTSNHYRYKYASPVDLTQFAQENEDE